jgi:peroxiredoxin Q/BCP
MDHDGELVSLMSLLGNPLIVYFYPKNNTPGCTKEACSFRDQYEGFKEFGAEVIGISGDSVSSHQQVKEKRRLPFILLSDENRIAEKAFAVKRNLFGMLPGRVTFVFDQKGLVIDRFNSASNPTKHVTNALEVLRKST